MAHNWKERKSSFLSLLLSIERCDGKVVLWVFAMERLWCLVVSKWALRRFLSVIVCARCVEMGFASFPFGDRLMIVGL